MRLAAVLSVAIGLAGGCSPPVLNMNTKPAPGGGAMFPLPGNAGFVAVSTESAPPSRGAKAKRHAATIVARFYQPDGTTPITPAPTDVSVKIGVADDSPSVALAGSPGEERMSSRFASPLGDYPDGIQGSISAKIDGRTVEVPFSAR